ncbi:unnamed protein product [Brachionus calyciflorus]|uniref:Magnesium-dependent phosphatase 1 n=1 Tax=Brachionus calyciflorus TaxID=104777 RepID=A0A813R5U8_9BILA|nr:unnamed protein product [Brachionus calyciflorus]
MSVLNSEKIESLPTKESKIIEKWNSLPHKPKCIVFDLDYTLWPFIVDHKVLPPFKKINHGTNGAKIFDFNWQEVKSNEDVSLILKTLKENCFKNGEFLCIASRATYEKCALNLIELFEWTQYLDSIQIYSGPKLKHMKQIQKELGIKNFGEVLFFDDSKLNIQTTNSLGVIGHQVTRHYGLTIEELINGLKKYNSNFSISR